MKLGGYYISHPTEREHTTRFILTVEGQAQLMNPRIMVDSLASQWKDLDHLSTAS